MSYFYVLVFKQIMKQWIFLLIQFWAIFVGYTVSYYGTEGLLPIVDKNSSEQDRS